jgi:hypothetical protein
MGNRTLLKRENAFKPGVCKLCHTAELGASKNSVRKGRTILQNPG